MRKRLAWLVCPLIVAAIVLVARFDKDYDAPSHGYDVKCVQSNDPPSAPASLACAVNPVKNTEQSEDRSPWWHKLVTWPEGVTAWLLLLTLGAVVWQAWETREAATATKTAAEAALKQAEHIVTSERAWMIAEPCEQTIPPEIEGMTTGITHVGFSVRFINKGKSPAFLLEIGYSGKVLPLKEELPLIQSKYEEREIFKWKGEGLPLLPQDNILKNHVNTWAKAPVRITRGYDVLWVYGYIKYRDAFGENRETCFCYRWVEEIEGWQKSGFIAGGPESYNRAT